MSKQEWNELSGQLSGEPPDGLAGLPAEHLRHLTEAIRGARHRQAAALHEAGEQAFGFVPRLLRGPIKRILG